MVDLVIVVPHLGDGGVQRVATTLANAWSREGRTIVIVTLYRETPCYAVDDAVRVISILDHLETPWLLRAVEAIRLAQRPVLERLGRLARRAAAACSRTGGRLVEAVARWLGLEVPERDPAWLVALRRFGHTLQAVAAALSPPRVFERFIEALPPGHPSTGLWRLYLPAWLRVRTLRAIVADLAPEKVLGLCGSTNVMTALAGEGLAMPVIISERNDPSRQRLEAPWNGFRKQFYDRADRVTANTHGALDALRRHVAASKLDYVPNPLVRPVAPSASTNVRSLSPAILNVGRLHPQKAQDVLVRAFAELGPGLAAWRLRVLGQGDCGPELAALAERLGVSDRVDWLGQVGDPYPYYSADGIFALPSVHEGMPNALLEAMSCGMPVVVSDGSPGPLELVEHERTGLVVRAGDVLDLARALERLASNPALRERLGRAARERVAEYDLPRALRAWDRVLDQKPILCAQRAADANLMANPPAEPAA